MSNPDLPYTPRSRAKTALSEAPRDDPTAASTVELPDEASGKSNAPVSFELALGELEAIVARMESGELTLEQSLLEYKRGALLLQFCQSALRDAQQQVKILEAGVLKDFSGELDNG